MSVFPIAKERYERREEQIFRDYVRRNIDQTNISVENAASAADAVATVWSFASLQVFADDAAAGAGGLTQGTFYRTATGQLMVKL